MNRKKLPIGIQTFRQMIEEGYYYVDKTPFVARMAEGGKYYFLSRPRRFGKSLFLDTLAEAFTGKPDLFSGLYLERHWNWGTTHPVIRISFAEGRLESRDQLDARIRRILQTNAQHLGITCANEGDIVSCFEELITKAARHFGSRTVVLVDEYDKPILDNLTDPGTARAMREGLRNLYSVLKGQDANLQLVFLTGVSKFSKVSIFSGLNNLSDITLDARYATICGYTESDLDTVFAPELEGLDREAIRHWYNGYRWDGEPVYNPFDVLLLLDKRQFRAFWFETGTPTFLVDWLQQRRFDTPKLERLFANEELLSAFDVDLIRPEAMLWQTGYLTIREKRITPAGPSYFLGLPNHEVRTALNRAIQLSWLPNASEVMEAALDLYGWLAENDQAALRSHFEQLYAGIPHDWYRSNPIAGYEGYFASVFYSHLAGLGLDITAEDVSSQGRCDLAIRYGSRLYLIEFKLVDGQEPTGEALAQLKRKNYAAKYAEEAVLIGIEFSKPLRQIVGWDVA
ncbi:ATP-binding protein [Desulfatirhabdium butyrativorans]|uniref:ATP-binding protein n=1 Tax=Desulfatirhabdium butyrativorans TaxID=340467 RepID=UPI0004283802|nr:ATP-binding protein [Desulfatirhabdium butyrativorans]